VEGAGVADALVAVLPRLPRVWQAPAGAPPPAPDADGAVRIGPWLSASAGSPDAYQLVRFRNRGA
jgi:hypothetical protein